MGVHGTVFAGVHSACGAVGGAVGAGHCRLRFHGNRKQGPRNAPQRSVRVGPPISGVAWVGVFFFLFFYIVFFWGGVDLRVRVRFGNRLIVDAVGSGEGVVCMRGLSPCESVYSSPKYSRDYWPGVHPRMRVPTDAHADTDAHTRFTHTYTRQSLLSHTNANLDTQALTHTHSLTRARTHTIRPADFFGPVCLDLCWDVTDIRDCASALVAAATGGTETPGAIDCIEVGLLTRALTQSLTHGHTDSLAHARAHTIRPAGFFGPVCLNLCWAVTDIRDCAAALVVAAAGGTETPAVIDCIGAVLDMPALLCTLAAEAEGVGASTAALPWTVRMHPNLSVCV